MDSGTIMAGALATSQALEHNKDSVETGGVETAQHEQQKAENSRHSLSIDESCDPENLLKNSGVNNQVPKMAKKTSAGDSQTSRIRGVEISAKGLVPNQQGVSLAASVGNDRFQSDTMNPTKESTPVTRGAVDSKRSFQAMANHSAETLNPLLDMTAANAYSHSQESANTTATEHRNTIDQNLTPHSTGNRTQPQRIFRTISAEPRASRISKGPRLTSKPSIPQTLAQPNSISTAEYEYVFTQGPQQSTPISVQHQIENLEINRLQREIENQRQEYQSQIETLQKLIDEQDQFLTHQEPDIDLSVSMDVIREEVQTFAKEAARMFKTPLGANTQLSNITQEMEEEIRMVIPIPGTSLQEIFNNMKGSRSRRFFVQGWVHLTLFKLIFRSNLQIYGDWNPEDLWLHQDTAKAVKVLENEFTRLTSITALDPKALHRWRASTLSILYSSKGAETPLSPENLKIIENRCHKMADVFHELIASNADELDLASEHKKERFFRDGLTEIFRNAVRLSSLLRTQKAAFGMRFPTVLPSQIGSTTVAQPFSPVPLYFDPNWMEMDDDPTELGSKLIVSYVIEPAWFKYGNANGEKYDTEAGCFMKAKVACLAVQN